MAKKENHSVFERKTNTYVTKPKISKLLILICLQYSLDISANTGSNFKILYIFNSQWIGLLEIGLDFFLECFRS